MKCFNFHFWVVRNRLERGVEHFFQKPFNSIFIWNHSKLIYWDQNYTSNPSSHIFQLFPTTKLHPIFRCREFFVCRRPKGVYWFIFSNAYIISELFKWISCSSPTVCIFMFILCYRAVYYLRPKNFSQYFVIDFNSHRHWAAWQSPFKKNFFFLDERTLLCVYTK